MLQEIKKRILSKEAQGEIERIYPAKESKIHMPYKEMQMEVSVPLFTIGYKDIEGMDNKEEIVKKHIAIEILLNMLLGKSSETYKQLYEAGDLLTQPDLDYEFSDQYAHILIAGQSKNPQKVDKAFETTVEQFKEKGLDQEHFDRIRKKVYGDYVVEYNSVGNIARMFLSDSMKGINSFDYIERFKEVTKEYTEHVLKNVFKTENKILSVINRKDKNK